MKMLFFLFLIKLISDFYTCRLFVIMVRMEFNFEMYCNKSFYADCDVYDMYYTRKRKLVDHRSYSCI